MGWILERRLERTMNYKTIELINEERSKQDATPGNSNNHSDAVWSMLIVKQLGQAVTAGQDYLFAAEHHSIREMYHREKRRHQLVQMTALCVAWLEDVLAHEPLE